MAHVLVVEDDGPVADVCMFCLRTAGHDVTCVTDGEEALALLRRKRFDVVLMDVQMPNLNGLDATRAIRRDPRLDGMAVIGVSGRTGARERAEMLSAGMDAIVPKPFGGQELRRAVDMALGLAGTEQSVGYSGA